MGMDLLGFVFVGPPKLKVKKLPAAELKKLCAEIKKQLEKLPPDTDLSQLDEGARLFLETLFTDSMSVIDTVVDVLPMVTSKRVGEACHTLFSSFAQVWNHGGIRRWVTRTVDGKSQKTQPYKIGVCAVESWGDSPDEEFWRICEMVSFMEPLAAHVLGLHGSMGSKQFFTLAVG